MKQIQRPTRWVQMFIVGSFLLFISACETEDAGLMEDDLDAKVQTEAKIQEAADRATKAEFRIEEIRQELLSVQQTLEQRDVDLQLVNLRLVRTQRLVVVLVLILMGLLYTLWRVRFAGRAMACPDWRAVLTNWGLLKPTSQSTIEVSQKDSEPKKAPPQKPAAKKTETKTPGTKKPAAQKPPE